MSCEDVFIALGANLNDPQANIQSAIARLQIFSQSGIKTSSLWQTTPVNCSEDSNLFVNAVVAIQVNTGQGAPETLLLELQAIEKEFGRRKKKQHNEARPLDLDIVCYGQRQQNSTFLQLPHPRAHLRQFVLKPLCEIASDLVLPGQQQSVSQLSAMLKTDEQLSVILDQQTLRQQFT